MMFLAPIVFVGILGRQHDAVEHQLQHSLDKAGITQKVVSANERTAIVKNGAASKKVVKNMHVGGVVAGEVTGTGNARSFRVVIYDGEGNLKTELESPIAAAGLTRDDISSFEATIADFAGSTKPAPAARIANAPTAMRGAHADDDAPPGLSGSAGAATHTERVAAAAPATDDDDGATSATAVVEPTAAAKSSSGIHAEAELLVGLVGRSLGTDPNTIKPYS